MTTRRKRRTRQEIMDELRAKLDKYEAQEDGTYIPDEETLIAKRIRKALKRRKTAIHQANVLLQGKAATEKSPAQNGIDDKIANAEARLQNLRDAKAHALDMIANLPFDIDRLEKIVEEMDKGNVPEDFPTGLYKLPNSKNDVEHENAESAGEPETASETA